MEKSEPSLAVAAIREAPFGGEVGRPERRRDAREVFDKVRPDLAVPTHRFGVRDAHLGALEAIPPRDHDGTRELAEPDRVQDPFDRARGVDVSDGRAAVRVGDAELSELLTHAETQGNAWRELSRGGVVKLEGKLGLPFGREQLGSRVEQRQHRGCARLAQLVSGAIHRG